MTINNKTIVFSIIIPVYNAATTIIETLSSVLGQTYQHFEIIVVDDGSTDQSLEIVNKFSDSRLYVFANSENRGRSLTRNVGIQRSKGDFLIFLDSDDWLAPNYLMEVGKILTPKTVYESIIPLVNYQRFNSFWKIKWSHPYPSNKFELDDVLAQNLFPISTMIFPRRFLIANKILFQENLGAYEDWLFIIDCCIHGSAIRYSGIETKLVFIRIHGRNTMKKNYFMAYGLREMLCILTNKLEPKQLDIFHSAFIKNIGLLLGYSGIKSFKSELSIKQILSILISHYRFKIASLVLK